MTLFERTWRIRDAFRVCWQQSRWERDGKLTEDATLTLDTLREICHADRSCFDPDPRIHALNEGKRFVWLEIQRFLNLPDEKIIALKVSEDE